MALKWIHFCRQSFEDINDTDIYTILNTLEKRSDKETIIKDLQEYSSLALSKRLFFNVPWINNYIYDNHLASIDFCIPTRRDTVFTVRIDLPRSPVNLRVNNTYIIISDSETGQPYHIHKITASSVISKLMRSILE